MVRMKVIEIKSSIAASNSPVYEESKKDEIAKVEEFIAQIGYDSIKNIIVSAPNNSYSYYSIFYEDNLPYTPRAETDAAKKKGIFG